MNYLSAQHGVTLSQLEPIATTLQSDPENYEHLKADYEQAIQLQKQVQQKVFALADVVQRKAHFNYAESVQTETSELNEQLRARLEQMQQQREISARTITSSSSAICSVQSSVNSIAKFFQQ